TRSSEVQRLKPFRGFYRFRGYTTSEAETLQRLKASESSNIRS
ncbi:hypothetical protein A2U01_0115227, partial [Trifolium medium]|nr:hypothetical protein [Trifolium medium]